MGRFAVFAQLPVGIEVKEYRRPAYVAKDSIVKGRDRFGGAKSLELKEGGELIELLREPIQKVPASTTPSPKLFAISRRNVCNASFSPLELG
jgi:hypothetical protein